MKIKLNTKLAHSFSNNWNSTNKTRLVKLEEVELMLKEIESYLEGYGGEESVRLAIKDYFKTNSTHPVRKK